MLHTLEEIRAAGARAVRDFPPLTVQQIDTIAALINPALAVPRAATVRTPITEATPFPAAA